jgi:L-ribulose-5-phosphate 3-epimerase
MNRREFLTTSSSLAAASAAAQTSNRLPIKKAVYWSMIRGQMSVLEKFQLAKDCGFEAIELPTATDPKMADEFKDASLKTPLPIHSVMNSDHWRYPLSSPDPAVVEKSLKGMETSLQNAKLWGGTTVLLVPAVVTPEVSYRDAWTRSQTQIRKLIPLATELKVIIGIENVWNKFLLSPLEMAGYVDEFKSPWVKAYFDVGNVVLFGYPQDWIRTLGDRICKLHLKDFATKTYTVQPEPGAPPPERPVRKRVQEFVNLRDGEINWKAVHQALAEIGYKGFATTELSGGDADYLKDVAHRVDLILEGA